MVICLQRDYKSISGTYFAILCFYSKLRIHKNGFTQFKTLNTGTAESIYEQIMTD